MSKIPSKTNLGINNATYSIIFQFQILVPILQAAKLTIKLNIYGQPVVKYGGGSEVLVLMDKHLGNLECQHTGLFLKGMGSTWKPGNRKASSLVTFVQSVWQETTSDPPPDSYLKLSVQQVYRIHYGMCHVYFIKY